METFIKNIDECFKKHINETTINKHKKYNKKIKIDTKYLILYRFFNSFFSKEKSSELINNFITYDRSSFHRQEQQINIDFYEQLNKDISIICNNAIKNKRNKYVFMGVDGTYSNGENYNNSLNMGYFDVMNDIPIEIDIKGINNKNKEIDALMDKIKSDINLFKNKVIVVDRLYFCYKLIHFLITHEIKFIIRCKGNCKNLKLNTVVKDKELIGLIKDNTRIITYNDVVTKTITINNKNKNKKHKNTRYTIDIKNDYVLITNLSKHFTNQKILNLYKLRWNIETYFKLVKHNFNFQHLTNKNEIEIEKQFLCINMICSICKIFNLYLTEHEKEINNDVLDELIIKCNETKLIRFFQNWFLKTLIIDKNTKYEEYVKKMKPYTCVRKYKKNGSNPRHCKTPFMKWYIKKYSNQSEIVKILEAIENGTLNDLNDNLKSKAKRIIIIKKSKIK